MILNREQLQVALRDGRIHIGPNPKPEHFGPISIDLALGNRVLAPKDVKVVDVDAHLRGKPLDDILEECVWDKYLLHPGKRVVAYTEAFIGLGEDIYAIIEGRSTTARLGLQVHCTSSVVQPGWRGPIALELLNTSTVPLRMKAGILAAAIRFYVCAPVGQGYVSRYQGGGHGYGS